MAHLVDPAPDPLVDREISQGKYRLEEFVSNDPLGRLYRGRHVALERHVTIKVLHGSHLEDAEEVKRFSRAGLAASRVRHPNVVDVLDLGQESDGSLYLVQEHIHGRTLREIVQTEGALGVDRAVDLITQVAAGIGAAHAAGVVHRDLKPETVAVVRQETDDGTVGDVIKVLDFAVAKIRDPVFSQQPRHRTLEMVSGTPEFMSPEACNGQAVDPRSDVYSAGCLLYYVLTGRPPFAGEALEILAKQVREKPVPPSRIRPDLDQALESVVLRALEKDPARRYQNGRDLCRALSRMGPTRHRPVEGSTGATVEIETNPDIRRERLRRTLMMERGVDVLPPPRKQKGSFGVLLLVVAVVVSIAVGVLAGLFVARSVAAQSTSLPQPIAQAIHRDT